MTLVLSAKLNSAQQAAYKESGYHYPLRAFSEEEAEVLKQKFLAYRESSLKKINKNMIPREQALFMMDTHWFLRWVYEIAANQNILDAVESVLGPNILVWGTQFFPKFPGDKAYVSWHQDAAYWGLSPANVTTAWVALAESKSANGCLRVIPKSHKTELPQRDTYAESNMLSRGQEIAVDVDESQAVDFVLKPGEFSLHHVGVVHGSGPNVSDIARIGVAIRYISPDVVQKQNIRDMTILVRGKDDYHHFDLAEPPEKDMEYGESKLYEEAFTRKAKRNSVDDNTNEVKGRQ